MARDLSTVTFLSHLRFHNRLVLLQIDKLVFSCILTNGNASTIIVVLGGSSNTEENLHCDVYRGKTR